MKPTLDRRISPMITEESRTSLSVAERSQLDRVQMARGSWAAGQIDNALLIIESVKSEAMSPRVAAECFVAEAAFRIDSGDRSGSMKSLAAAAPSIDSAPLSVRGAFHHQRGRLHKEAGDLDAAFTDYAGAETCWREIGATEKLGAVVLNLAGVCLKLNDVTRAHDYAIKAVEIFTQTESFYISQAYDTQSQIFLAEGKIQAALFSIDKALTVVGDNDTWRAEFEITKEKIIGAIIDLIMAANLDVTAVQREMVRHALVKHGGNLTKASKEIGMSRNGVSYIIDCNQDLEPLRVGRRVRHESIIK